MDFKPLIIIQFYWTMFSCSPWTSPSAAAPFRICWIREVVTSHEKSARALMGSKFKRQTALSRLTMEVVLKTPLVQTDAKRSKLSCSRFCWEEEDEDVTFAAQSAALNLRLCCLPSVGPQSASYRSCWARPRTRRPECPRSSSATSSFRCAGCLRRTALTKQRNKRFFSTFSEKEADLNLPYASWRK